MKVWRELKVKIKEWIEGLKGRKGKEWIEGLKGRKGKELIESLKGMKGKDQWINWTFDGKER